MVRVSFTQNLQRHVPCPPCEVSGGDVREALSAAFALYPRLEGYVLDERSAVRKHMIVFLNGDPIVDRDRLSDPLKDGDEVHVFQALSGG